MQENNSKRKVITGAWLPVLSSIVALVAFFVFSTSGCRLSTDVDQHVTIDSGPYLIEKDLLYNGHGEVDLYHETVVINTSVDTLSLSVESHLPDTLKHTSRFSPVFGGGAIIPTLYRNYFHLPNVNSTFHTNDPDSTATNSYFWKNVKLGHSVGVVIPYSNYYGSDSRIFIEKLGTSRFLNLEVVSDYSITKNSVYPKYIDIQIKETLRNTSNQSLYGIGTHIFVPKKLMIKPDPYNSVYANLYNLVTENVTSPSNTKFDILDEFGTGEGFGFFATGQFVATGDFVLLPHQSFEFVFKMTIEPLLDRFEIYPSYGFLFITKGGSRIWPTSIVTINGKRYDGEVHYLKVSDLVLPTYILFSIDHGVFTVTSPDSFVPTFTPPTSKMQKEVKSMNVQK